MRIQKYFAEQKIISRREAERQLRAGNVKVNGRVVTDFNPDIDPKKDKVELIKPLEEKLTIVYHKPRGISSSKIASEGTNIFDLLPQFKHLNAIGRLDKDSEGIILLSNDGVLTNIITGQDHLIEKEYLIEVRERVTQSQMNALEKGMILEDGPTLPAQAKVAGEHAFHIILREGRNHQIRRMSNKVRLTITKLQRIRIGHVKMNELAVGGYRILSQTEVNQFK
jgi:pseudouridine synthase